MEEILKKKMPMEVEKASACGIPAAPVLSCGAGEPVLGVGPAWCSWEFTARLAHKVTTRLAGTPEH